jgi:MFS family permease
MATTQPESSPTSPLRFMARALSHRNYRLFFVGQGVSLIGTWMTRIATSWLVFRLSGSDAALLLGLVGFSGLIPTFFLAPFAGVLVDRWNRHRLLVVTQLLALVQSALLALVAFRGEPGAATLWQIAALSFCQGVINAFDMPARQVLLVELVDRREDLPNAIALNSFLVNGARLIGPSLAGLLIATVGEAWCFVVDAVSYVAVVVALLLMRLSVPKKVAQTGSLKRNLAEGFSYAFGFGPIRSLLLLLALVSFMGMPYSVLLPMFADTLGSGPSTLGFLTTASGVGALAGALLLASRRSILGLGRLIVFATALFGLGLVGFALSPLLWVSLLMMLATGFGLMVQLAASNTILQTIADEDKRGRVMSYFSMAFLGVAPFGSLFAGVMAREVGAPYTVLAGGVACLLGGLLFAWKLPRLRELTRPVYARLGILPEVAGGLNAAAMLNRPPQDGCGKSFGSASGPRR